MSDSIISVENLGKRYRIRHQQQGQRYVALRDVLASQLTSPRRWFKWNQQRQTNKGTEHFWALKHVSFEVKPGEVVGIIGRNGAGKSTLLKILSRITEPSQGRVTLDGRVASLLEVGTGFHPELTGRENIFLNGAILGMARAEIKRNFDEIVAFAEVEQFLDTPVKRYSSGMYVRLAFAVAAHLEPEILVVDEVLAVGDTEFQRKCLSKINDVSRHGRTVLFVSHNMTAVRTLCTRAIILSEGTIIACGEAGPTISRYLASAHASDHNTNEWPSCDMAPGADFLKLRKVAVRPAHAPPFAPIDMRTAFAIDTHYWVLKSGVLAHITYHLLNHDGILVFTTASRPAVQEQGAYSLTCHVPADLLNSGNYTLRVLLIRNGSEQAFAMDDVASFTVIDGRPRDSAYVGREPGVVQPRLQWETRHEYRVAITPQHEHRPTSS